MSLSASLTVSLANMPSLAELFRLFLSGKHLNRLAEPTLWAELEKQEADYSALFTALGYELRIDARGFAWFHTTDANSNIGKTSRQLALLFMVIFEAQANAGKPLLRFSDWLIDSLRAHRELSLFDDVHFTPILADRVASSAHALLACEASGIFHVCGDERISKYAFALQLADEFGLPRDLIRRASMAGAGLRAPRPNDMSLSNAKLRAALGRGPVSVRDDLRSLHAQEPTRQPELFGAVTT